MGRVRDTLANFLLHITAILCLMAGAAAFLDFAWRILSGPLR